METHHLTVVESPDDEHTTTVRELLAAFTMQDRLTIERLISADCVWRVPGRSPVAGEYVGHDAVLALFGYLRRVFDVPAQFDIVAMATGGDRVISYQYGVAVADGREVRLKECLVFRIEGTQIVEVDEFQFDLEAFDAIFRGHPLRVEAE